MYVGLGVAAAIVASGVGVTRCACGSGTGVPDDKLAGLVVEPVTEEREVDVASATADPMALRHALTTPHRQLATAIGAHRFAGSSRVRLLEDGKEIELLEDETRLEVAAGGNFLARLDNSRDYGREAYFVDGDLYLRPRFGKYHRRAPTSDEEPLAIRDDVFATLGAYFEVAAAAAAIEDQGETTHQGRRARKLGVSLAASPSAPTAPAGEHRAWRGEVAVQKLEAAVVLDAETGAPLSGTLQAAVQFVRDGRTLVMELDAKHEVSDIGSGDIAVAAPDAEAVVDTPRRQHEVIERDKLLEGLAPPARAKQGGAP